MEEKKDKITSSYAPKGKEEKLLRRVYDRYEMMKKGKQRQDAQKVWKKAKEQWEALRTERGADDWQSNHYVPITTAVVETALSEVIDQSPKPMILPRGSEDAPKATVMNHVFEYTWDVSDSDLEFEEIVHDAFIYGTGIGQEYFYKDIRMIRKTVDSEETEATDYEDCYLEAVPLEDFYVDENARGFRGPYGARDCIRKYSMHIDDFRNFFKGKTWDPLGNAKYVKPGGDIEYYTYYKPEIEVYGDKQVCVLWYWSVKPDDWLIIVANDVIVFMGPNPYKHKQLPFSRAIDVKRTHHFYGKGEAELLESIQDEVNTLRRMIIDRNHLDIDKMFLGSSRLNLSDEDVITRPHGFIPVEDPALIKAVEYGDIPRSVELSLQHLEDDGTIVTGINPRQQSLPTTGTATEAAILKESTLKRIRLKVRRLEREFLTRVARLRVANILQFYSQPKLEKIVGEGMKVQYEAEIAELEARGIKETRNLVKTGKDLFKKSFRTIRMEDKEIDFDEKGSMLEKNKPGVNFFELKPEYFMPNEGGYDIKFSAGSTLPISEPLMQSKATEMYDRLIQLAIGGVGYDPVKLGDLLLKVNHFNPSDFHVQQQAEGEDTARIQNAIELASIENNIMMETGAPVPQAANGTPYAPALHTRVHIEFTSSEPFQALEKTNPRVQIMIDHIVGEIAAQSTRAGQETPGQGQGTPGGNGIAPPQQSPVGGTMQDIAPGQITGGGQAPPAI